MKIPVFAAVEECLREGILPGAIERNQEYSMAWAVVESDDGDETLPVLYDPQTSGGLLVALPKDAAGEYVKELRARGHAAAAVIGRMVSPAREGLAGKVIVINTKLGNFIGTKEGAVMQIEKNHAVIEPKTAAPASRAREQSHESCCDSPPGLENEPDDSKALEIFSGFMRAAGGKGTIDRRTKKLISVSLSIALRCRPCLSAHMKGALAMGITMAEIEEAASLAVSFAGCPALMLYKEVCEEIEGKRGKESEK